MSVVDAQLSTMRDSAADSQLEGQTWAPRRAMMDAVSCLTCNLGIKMRYSVSGPLSKSQGYWAHLDTAAGIAADLDHAALR